MHYGLGCTQELLSLVTRREGSLWDAKELACICIHLGSVQ